MVPRTLLRVPGISQAGGRRMGRVIVRFVPYYSCVPFRGQRQFFFFLFLFFFAEWFGF